MGESASEKVSQLDLDSLVQGADNLSSALTGINDLFTYLNANTPGFTTELNANAYSEVVTSLASNLENLTDTLQWAQDTYTNFAYIEAILKGTNPATFDVSQYGITDVTGIMGKYASGNNTTLAEETSSEIGKTVSLGVSATAFTGKGWEALTASAGAGYELGVLGVSASAYAAAALFNYSAEVGFSEYDKWELGVELGSAKVEGNCVFSLKDADGNFMPGIGAEVGASIAALNTEISVHAGYGGENNNLIGGFVNGELEAGSASASALAKLGMDEDHQFACVLGAEASLIAVKAGLAGGITVLGTDVGAGVEALVGVEAKGKFGYSEGKFEATVGLALVVGLEVNLVIDLSDTVETVQGIWGDVKSWCTSTASKVGDALESAANTIKNVAVQTVDKVKSLAQSVAQKAKDAAEEIAEKTKKAAEEAAEKAKKAAEEAAEKAKKAAEEAKKAVTSTANKVASAVKDAATKVKDAVVSTAKKIWKVLKKW